MSGTDDVEPREFVTRQRSALLRTAVPTGTGRGWPAAAIRRPAPGGCWSPRTTGWRRRTASSEQVVEAVPDRGYDAVRSERSAAVLQALRDLPPRMRAVVVPRHHEDHSEATTAGLLGRHGRDAGLPRAVPPPRRPRRPAVAVLHRGAVVDEQDLRTLVHSATGGAPPAVPDGDATADAVVAAHRARRRQRLGVPPGARAGG